MLVLTDPSPEELGDPLRELQRLLDRHEPELALAKLRELQRDDRAPYPGALLDLAYALRAEGRLALGGAVAREVLEASSSGNDRSSALAFWVQSLVFSGRELDAVEVLERELSTERTRGSRCRIAYELMRVLLRLGEDQRAFELLRAMSFVCGTRSIARELCEYHAARGEWSEVLRWARTLRETEGLGIRDDVLVARSLVALRDPGAEAACRTGLSGYHDVNDFASELASLAHREGWLDELDQDVAAFEERSSMIKAYVLGEAIERLRALDRGDAELLFDKLAGHWESERTWTREVASSRDAILALLERMPAEARSVARDELQGPRRRWALAVLARLGDPELATLTLHDLESGVSSERELLFHFYLLAIAGTSDARARLAAERDSVGPLSVLAGAVIEMVRPIGPRRFSVSELQRCEELVEGLRRVPRLVPLVRRGCTR